MSEKNGIPPEIDSARLRIDSWAYLLLHAKDPYQFRQQNHQTRHDNTRNSFYTPEGEKVKPIYTLRPQSKCYYESSKGRRNFPEHKILHGVLMNLHNLIVSNVSASKSYQQAHSRFLTRTNGPVFSLLPWLSRLPQCQPPQILEYLNDNHES
jgi:hypothetical protein